MRYLITFTALAIIYFVVITHGIPGIIDGR
jgi:hypothetical protein